MQRRSASLILIWQTTENGGFGLQHLLLNAREPNYSEFTGPIKPKAGDIIDTYNIMNQGIFNINVFLRKLQWDVVNKNALYFHDHPL